MLGWVTGFRQMLLGQGLSLLKQTNCMLILLSLYILNSACHIRNLFHCSMGSLPWAVYSYHLANNSWVQSYPISCIEWLPMHVPYDHRVPFGTHGIFCTKSIFHSSRECIATPLMTDFPLSVVLRQIYVSNLAYCSNIK